MIHFSPYKDNLSSYIVFVLFDGVSKGWLQETGCLYWDALPAWLMTRSACLTSSESELLNLNTSRVNVAVLNESGYSLPRPTWMTSLQQPRSCKACIRKKHISSLRLKINSLEATKGEFISLSKLRKCTWHTIYNCASVSFCKKRIITNTLLVWGGRPFFLMPSKQCWLLETDWMSPCSFPGMVQFGTSTFPGLRNRNWPKAS